MSNQNDDNEILAMFDGGLAITAIALELGMSASTVSAILKAAGRDTKRKPKQVDETGIINDYINEVPVPDILTKYGINYGRLYIVLRDNNVELRKVVSAQANVERLEAAVGLYVKKAPLWSIKQETGVSQPTLHAELHRRNIPLRRPRML